MTDLIVSPSKVQGEIEIPTSKSHSIRAILFASLAKGESVIKKRLDSPDIHAAIRACRQFGAKIEERGEDLIILGTGATFKSPKDSIDSGNSGQVLRFVGAFAALGNNKSVITGDHSIRTSRPVLPLISALSQLGARAKTSDGGNFAPIEVQGKISAGQVEMDGMDSQPVSAILMLAAFLNRKTTVKVRNPGEKPWIDLTLSWLDRFNISYENKDYQTYFIQGRGGINSFEYTVPGDFSSAAFPAVAGLISNTKVNLQNMDMSDSQGDKKVFQALEKMGAKINYHPTKRTIEVKRDKQDLYGQSLDINDYIDAITILSVLGCFAKNKTHIHNASIARKKESDRIASICKELKKMGAKVDEKQDGLIIYPSKLSGAKLNCYHDHRIAMSLAIAAMNARGDSRILKVDCISKSYPTFIQDMKKLGAKMEAL